MAKQIYKIVTSKQETELVEADRVERVDSSARTVDLYMGDALVGSFVGYSSFSVYNPSLEKQVTP